MGLDYLDLYLINWPVAMKYIPFEEKYPAGYPFDENNKVKLDEGISLAETWRAMEYLVKEGLVR